MIRVWKKARLARDAESLGFPSISILGKLVELGPDALAASRGLRPHHNDDRVVTDADRVQYLVSQMPVSVRQVFEAYHLGLIGGDSHRGERHKYRAKLLGMPYSTYKYKVNSGWHFLQKYLQI